MRALSVLGAAALAACGDPALPSQPLPDAQIVAPALPSDTYFILAMPTCDAPDPASCVMELGFCSDGSYRHKHGDAITASTYGVVYPDIVLDPNGVFQFDLEGDFSDDASGTMYGPWHATTAATDADVRCAR